MRGKRVRLHGLTGLAILLPTLWIAHPASATDRLTETRRRLASTRAQLHSARATDAQMQATIGRLSAQLIDVRNSLGEAQGTLAKIEAMMRAEERKLADLERQRAARGDVVGRRARQLYMMGPAAGAGAILSAASFQDFIERTSSLEAAMRYDRVMLEDLARISDQSRKARATLARERETAAGIRRVVADRALELGDVLATKQAAEDAMAARIAAYEQEIRALEVEQARIIALIRSRQSRSNGAISRSGFIWPVNGPITSPYGRRGSGFHTGIDINCETGDTIVASKGGVVIASEWGGGYGRMIIIDHGNGVSTLYAHNSRLYVGDGQAVDRGQRISACGETGNASGSHLHFEVRINGEHTNPRPFLP